MKIGIIGCGANSDYHISFARNYAGVEIVGIVDRDQERAHTCARKHNIQNVCSDVTELVERTQPEVIHILTPPRTHFALAKEAIELKCHALVEKPLALNLEEAQTLYRLAEQNRVILCTMHNHNFDPCIATARKLVRSGQAGEIVSIESYYGLNTMIPAFREYPAPNVLPWLYQLPYGVYHDFLAHPLYVLLDYTGRPKEISVMKHARGVLPHSMPDEIRILVNGEKALGVVTISFAAKPHVHFVKIYGTKMILEVDINTMSCVQHPVSSLPKAATKATYNLSTAWQLLAETSSNVLNFLRGTLKPYQGMKVLIHKFYDCVEHGTECPVSKEQALLTIATIDEIGKHLACEPPSFLPIVPQPGYVKRHCERILVTGGTGFLGQRLVQRLVEEGYPVRVLARKLANVEFLKNLGVEIFFGDVADKDMLEQCFTGIDIVVHAAAGTKGNSSNCEQATITGTENILRLCEQTGIQKLIYVSSCSVYGVADYQKGDVVTESSSLERFPSRRGLYSSAKHTAECLVRRAMEERRFPIVVLRPGTIYGPGGDLFTPMIGISLLGKGFVVFGNGKFELPLVYVDNLADAIIRCIANDRANNKIFNIVDGERVTKRVYMDKLVRRAYPKVPVFYCPSSLIYSAVLAQEILCKVLKREPFLTRYRLVSSQNPIRYDSSKIVNTLGWAPTVRFDEAVDRLCAS